MDHQRANWHPLTNQRIAPASEIMKKLSPNEAIANVSIENNGDVLRIDWEVNKSSSILELNKLQQRTSTNSRYGLPNKILWSNFVEFPKSSYLSPSPHKILKDLCNFGVHLVTEMPETVIDTERYIRSYLGPPRETFYGGMWDTAPRKENINDTAYTYDSLDPHTDTCYLIDSPGLQCFNCVAQDSGEGGKTKLVDSEVVVKKLRKSFQNTFDFFRQTNLVFHHTEDKYHARVCTPVINLEPDENHLKQFRYNEYDLAPLNYLDRKMQEEFYLHNAILRDVIEDHVFTIKLNIGEMLVVDNHRVMHGRTAFKGYRNLIGCYVGADDWIMRARKIFEKET